MKLHLKVNYPPFMYPVIGVDGLFEDNELTILRHNNESYDALWNKKMEDTWHDYFCDTNLIIITK